ncbi:MAG: hypothetical protein WC736_10055 [Gallionella sp.]|jgi:hypothetical protein
MTSGSGAVTLAQVRGELRPLMPEIANLLDIRFADTYEKFVDCIYQTLDGALAFIEENPQLRKNDSEDRLTIEIVGLLRQSGLDASHDSMHGGHSDIVVKRASYSWLAEAKIHSSYPYLFQGFNQLTTRYANGSKNNNKGCLLMYIRQKNAAVVVNKWKEHLTNKKLTAFNISNCSQRGAHGFYSTHNHTGSGCHFEVRHIGVLLHHDPQDV